eukprot:COSAG02_NODE_2498_length_8675_cov_6.885378_6_plen_91_part_00
MACPQRSLQSLPGGPGASQSNAAQLGVSAALTAPSSVPLRAVARWTATAMLPAGFSRLIQVTAVAMNERVPALFASRGAASTARAVPKSG